MKKIVLASNNKGKIKEFKKVLEDYEILTLNDVGYFEDIVEDGNTLLENSLIKAKATTKFLNSKGIEAFVIADDSGLFVNALNGAPGVYSARYAGNHNDQANRDKLLRELKDKTDRTAYFACVLTVMKPDGTYKYVEGKTFGEITTKETGENGFGFDPLFYSNDLKKTFAQASEEEKNLVSHRGRAIQMLIEKKLLD